MNYYVLAYNYVYYIKGYYPEAFKAINSKVGGTTAKTTAH